MGDWATRDVAFLALALAAAALLVPVIVFVVGRPRLSLHLDTQERDDSGTVVAFRVTNFGSRDAVLTRWGLRRDPRGKLPRADLQRSPSGPIREPREPPTLYKGLQESPLFPGQVVSEGVQLIPGRSVQTWYMRVAPVTEEPATYEGPMPPLMDEKEWFPVEGGVSYRPLSLWNKTAKATLGVALVHRSPGEMPS
jgi:hypothetical protein